jgi:hypothetical protein
MVAPGQAQPALLPRASGANGAAKASTSSTFVDNMRLPVHRWFRFSAGFSAQWAEEAIAHARESRPVTVLDPFAGSGTTLLAAEQQGVPSFGVEAHPFVARVARAKLLYRSDRHDYIGMIRAMRDLAATLRADLTAYPPLIRTCFSDESLAELDRLRRAWLRLADGSPASELSWLTLVCILRQVSQVGTAPWQYVLPNKKKRQPWAPMVAFDRMAAVIASDMLNLEGTAGARAEMLRSDARTCEGVPDASVDLVLTSPPYPNNYDYADATRLEMSFMQEVRSWGQLHDAVRQYLVRSCSQHATRRAVDLDAVLASPLLDPIRAEIEEVCTELARVRLAHGGRKTYHLMVACYFLDMARVWQALRRVCRTPAWVCWVIGDSAPYGVYVPVVEWLGALALSAGFASFSFEKMRDRNVKWENRKHKVPLVEGRLWVEG